MTRVLSIALLIVASLLLGLQIIETIAVLSGSCEAL